jgi:hypothetical protein
MADYLTRLIDRSRGLTPLGQRVEPLIAPRYAAGPNLAPPNDGPNGELNGATDGGPDDGLDDGLDDRPVFLDGAMDEARASIEPGSRTRISAQGQRPHENPTVATASQRREAEGRDTPETKSARTLADEGWGARIGRTRDVEPIVPTRVDERLGLADRSGRADKRPAAARRRTTADGSDSRAGEAAGEGETAAPVIRVTIGRVDVRAVNAPAPPARRETTPAPKLTLEDYLRSRSGRE